MHAQPGGLMKKSELVEKVSKSTNITKLQAKAVVNAVCEVIKNGLQKDGNRVTLPGFGTFSTVKRKARTGRNPQTGQAIKIAARRVPKFSDGKSFKENIR
ncbi:MAG: HU family DNA-binding protein [Leptospirales bacterium]